MYQTESQQELVEPPFIHLHQLGTQLDSELLKDKKTNDTNNDSGTAMIDSGHLFCNGGLYLPGHPDIPLPDDPSGIHNFLYSELHSPDLERMAPYLWLLSKQSSLNVSPLHRQLIKGRNIVITEDPRLHLVWIADRIFIKPIPAYLLSYTFWKYYLDLSRNRRNSLQAVLMRRSALGILRSYALLIQHRSDFEIAVRSEARLIPDGIEYLTLSRLLASVRSRVDDSQVSSRYLYGELRLSRLNFYGKFILRRCYFQRIYNQYGTYFAQYYGPLLFVLGLVSILLNAMQVELAIEQVFPGQIDVWWPVCKWFAISTLIIVAATVFWFAAMFMYMFAKEWSYALHDRWSKKQKLEDNKETNSA